MAGRRTVRHRGGHRGRGRRRAGAARPPGRCGRAARAAARLAGGPRELGADAADPGPFNGTVQLDNELGLPALPDAPQAANGTSTAQIWSGGDDKGRVQIPTDSGERTLVSDGTTFWAWNSDDRTVVKGTRQPDQTGTAPADPTKAATDALADAAAHAAPSASTAPTRSRAAGAYELVLAPKPTERTLLREVRIAVDAQKRMPLRLTVLAPGLDRARAAGRVHRPHVRPAGPGAVHVHPAARRDGHGRPAPRRAARSATADVVGDGWDRVVVGGPRNTPARPGQARPRRARHARSAGPGAADG